MSKSRILFIDDNGKDHERFQDALKSLNLNDKYDISGIGRGSTTADEIVVEAEKLIRSEPDLIITDLELKRGETEYSGYKIIEAAHRHEIPVIVLTNFEKSSDVFQEVDKRHVKPEFFLNKDILDTPEKFFRIVDSALNAIDEIRLKEGLSDKIALPLGGGKGHFCLGEDDILAIVSHVKKALIILDRSFKWDEQLLQGISLIRFVDQKGKVVGTPATGNMVKEAMDRNLFLAVLIATGQGVGAIANQIKDKFDNIASVQRGVYVNVKKIKKNTPNAIFLADGLSLEGNVSLKNLVHHIKVE